MFLHLSYGLYGIYRTFVYYLTGPRSGHDLRRSRCFEEHGVWYERGEVSWTHISYNRPSLYSVFELWWSMSRDTLINAGAGPSSSSDGWNRLKGRQHSALFLSFFSEFMSCIIWINFSNLAHRLTEQPRILRTPMLDSKILWTRWFWVWNLFFFLKTLSHIGLFLMPFFCCSWDQAGTSASILFCCVLFWVSLHTCTSKFLTHT